MAIEHNSDGSLKKSAIISQAHDDAAQALTNAANAATTASSAETSAANALTVANSKLSSSLLGVAGGIATLDNSGLLSQHLDAARISQGTLDLARIPDLSSLYQPLNSDGTLVLLSYDGSTTPLNLLVMPDGSVKAIPTGATAPATPANLAADIHLTFVNFSWNSVVDAAKYVLYRDGTILATITSTSYTDSTVVQSAHYNYAVQAVNQYGMLSTPSAPLAVYIDPALNAAPNIDSITIWPTNPRPNDVVYIHVNARDVDMQTLTMALGVDAGQLTASSFDPSTWIWQETA